MAAGSVDEYVAGLSGWQAEAARALRALVKGVAPDAKESIKWAQPVFEAGGPVCYFKAHKAHVTFGFWRGKQLDDPAGLLESGGDMMAHVKLRSAELPPQLEAFVRQAVALNGERGDPSKRK